MLWFCSKRLTYEDIYGQMCNSTVESVEMCNNYSSCPRDGYRLIAKPEYDYKVRVIARSCQRRIVGPNLPPVWKYIYKAVKFHIVNDYRCVQPN